MMSINDQFAGGKPFAVLRCEKIQLPETPNKTDIFQKISKKLAQIFPIPLSRR